MSTPDEYADVQELTWTQGREAGQRAREGTKQYVIEIRDPDTDELRGVLPFEYGMLSPSDRDHVQKTGVTTKASRTGEDVEVSSQKIVMETLDRGLRDGPEGFSLTKQDILDFMEAFPDHSEDLAEHIQNFSEMQDEVRKTFRPPRAREECDAEEAVDATGGG